MAVSPRAVSSITLVEGLLVEKSVIDTVGGGAFEPAAGLPSNAGSTGPFAVEPPGPHPW